MMACDETDVRDVVHADGAGWRWCVLIGVMDCISRKLNDDRWRRLLSPLLAAVYVLFY